MSILLMVVGTSPTAKHSYGYTYCCLPLPTLPNLASQICVDDGSNKNSESKVGNSSPKEQKESEVIVYDQMLQQDHATYFKSIGDDVGNISNTKMAKDESNTPFKKQTLEPEIEIVHEDSNEYVDRLHAFGRDGSLPKQVHRVNNMQIVLQNKKKSSSVLSDINYHGDGDEKVESTGRIETKTSQSMQINNLNETDQTWSLYELIHADVISLIDTNNAGGGWVVITDVMYDTGANISINEAKAALKNVTKVDLNCAGVLDTPAVIDYVGEFGLIKKCYNSDLLRRNIVPPQDYLVIQK